MEECILIDKQTLNEIIIPTMNVDRRLADGTRKEEETVNKSQIYVNFFGQNVTIFCILFLSIISEKIERMILCNIIYTKLKIR